MNTLGDLNPTHTVCFSGHRPDRLPGGGEPNAREMRALTTALSKQIEEAVRRGKTHFLHGCMAGFDIVAAEQVIAIKKRVPQIALISVAPYSAYFFSREKCWTPQWINRARQVFRQHDFGVKIAEYYRFGIYYERNRELVRHSSELICFWDGKSGGTAYTVRYAEENGVRVRNLAKNENKEIRI